MSVLDDLKGLIPLETRIKRMLVVMFIFLIVMICWFFTLGNQLNHLLQVEAYDNLPIWTQGGMAYNDTEINEFYRSPFKPLKFNYVYFILGGLCIVYFMGDIFNFIKQTRGLPNDNLIQGS